MSGDVNIIFVKGYGGCKFSDIEELGKNTNSKLIIFVEPWDLDFSNSKQNRVYSKIISDCIFPSQKLLKNIKNRLNVQQRELLTIHARMGDYSRWREGAFYYNFHEYVELAISKKIKNREILVITNEPNPDFLFEIKKNNLLFINGSDIEDFVSLMFSDLIIGPPSTFSALARSISLKLMLKKTIKIEFLKERNLK